MRPAVPADLPRLLAIRDASGNDALSDPALVGETLLRRLIAAGSVTICQDGGCCVDGFVAIEGHAIHLLVDTGARGKGIGRALLAAACAMLKAAGHSAATLTLAAGSTARRHYRAAGWAATAPSASGANVLKKRL
jgi:GNAT superfamily N-acetyltransferase